MTSAAKSAGAIARPTGAAAPVEVEIDGRVAILKMRSPSTRNALSRPMIATLAAEVRRLSEDANVCAVVLTGDGPAFCAGHDLKELTLNRASKDGGRAFFAELMGECAQFMQSIVTSPKPFIAAVDGIATAAGCQLVATCDLAVAGSEARFATPGVNIGLFCSTPMVALSRNVSRKHAMEMLLTGDMVDAETAARIGLVNSVVPAGQAFEAALALARKIAAKSRSTIAIGKRAFYAQAEMPLAEAYAYAGRVMIENMMQADASEGICAFIEKRKPTWTS